MTRGMLVVTVVCLLTGLARGQSTDTIEAAARITKVDGKKVTIDRGTSSGIKVGDAGGIFPVRATEVLNDLNLDLDLRLAAARVTEVTADSATLTLDAITDTIDTSSVFVFEQTVPIEVGRSSVARLVLNAIELSSFKNDALFITPAAVFADRNGKATDAALDAIVAEIKNLKVLAVDAYTSKPEAGRYQGKGTGAIIDGLDRSQVLAFIDYANSYALSYVGKRIKAADAFLEWAIFLDAKSGEYQRKVHNYQPTLVKARDALRAGKFDDARAIYVRVLKDWPDNEEGRSMVERVDAVSTLTRALAADPDDTASEYELMMKLYQFGAYELALSHVAPLEKRKFDPERLERLRGLTLSELNRWAEATDAYEKLKKAAPADDEVDGLIKFARLQAKATAAPKDAGATLAVADALLADESLEKAVAMYRKVLDNTAASTKQREAAAKGQLNVSYTKQLHTVSSYIIESARGHRVASVRNLLPNLIKVADKLSDRAPGNKVLDAAAEAALGVGETDLAIELQRKRVERSKDRPGYVALARALLGQDRLDEAEAAAKQAIAAQGDELSTAYLLLAYVARTRGNLAEMEKHATKAASDKTYAWPKIVLARVEAAKGEWEDANTLARKALDMTGTERKDELNNQAIRFTVTATARGLQAHEALRADPKSARERLRLIRALAELGLVKQARAEIAKLPSTGSWRTDGWSALADSTDVYISRADRLAALREAKPTTPSGKRKLAMLEAETTLRSKPGDDTTRIALAKLYLLDQSPGLAISTLQPLLAKDPIAPAVAAIANDALSVPPTEQWQAGQDAFSRGDYEAVVRIYLELQQTYDKLGMVVGRVNTRTSRASALWVLGRISEALKVTEEAHAIAAADGLENRVLTEERNIAQYRDALGTSDTFGTVLRQQLKTCEALDNEGCLYSAHRALAELERSEGHLAVAIDHARLAWNYADRLGAADSSRLARVQLALISMNANRVADAEQVATKVLADARAVGATDIERMATMLLGGVAQVRGDGPAARRRYQEVYDIATRQGSNMFRAIARRFEGGAWLDADHQPAKAVVALEQSVALYTQSPNPATVSELGTTLRRLAQARLETGDLVGARKAAEQGANAAEKSGKRNELSSSNLVLALVAIAEKKPDEALKRAKQAVSIAEQTDAVILLWNDYHALARAYELKKQDRDALAAYETAIKYQGIALEAAGVQDQAGLMNDRDVRELYRNAVDLMLRLGMTARAREILELSRDAMLKQSFDATRITTEDKGVKALLDKYTESRDRVNALQAQLVQAVEKKNTAQIKVIAERLAKARTELDQTAGELKLNDRQLFQALTMAPQEIAARASSLPTGTVVVEYFMAKDTLSIFVHAAKKTSRIEVKVGATELAKTIDEFRDAITAENSSVKQTAKVENLGRQLAKWLLVPIKSNLADAKTVVIVPFGPLYYVPFDGLVMSDEGKPVHYALEDYRFAVQTTWTLESLLKPARPRSTGGMLAIANPDGTLPGAQREVARIVKTAALPDAKVLDKKDGTIAKVTQLAGSSRYLHIATHGILDADPRKSHLKLSDGVLTVREIASLQGLRTNNNLVVLSACDTATELRDSAGDELVSLASSFSLAGAPAVVASLWEISDDSTAELMATFYRSLEKDKGDRLDALRTAKLNLLRKEKDGKHPFEAPWHWASFQLYGDFRAPGAK